LAGLFYFLFVVKGGGANFAVYTILKILNFSEGLKSECEIAWVVGSAFGDFRYKIGQKLVLHAVVRLI